MRWSSGQTGSISFAGQKNVIEHSGMQSKEADPNVDQEMLLREMQHRVANSLQIVASILSLKARTVQSDEARVPVLSCTVVNRTSHHNHRRRELTRAIYRHTG